MLKVENIMDIKELKQAGHSIKSICRLTGFSRNTVRKVLRGEHSLTRASREETSILDPYKDYVHKRVEDVELSAVRLMEEIQSMGYSGSIVTLRRYLRTLKPEQKRKQKLTVRFETPPGKQAQVDWSYCGRFSTPEGKTIPIYFFIIVLSYSRMIFIQFTTSMKMPELLRCHQDAFEFFGGWPETILYDNMKQVKISRNQWNETFMDFANHYGFIPKTHRPYRPRTKGKVERGADYIKGNFLTGRSFDGISDLNAQALHWMNNTANTRVHGTTKKRPIDLFPQETLIPYESTKPYRHIDPVARKVNYESMVNYLGSRYSVPPEYAGKTVEVTAQGGMIIINCLDIVVAEHRQALKPGQCIVNKDHIAELWKLTEQQVKPPSKTPWNVTFQPSVQQTPLAIFEEIST